MRKFVSTVGVGAILVTTPLVGAAWDSAPAFGAVRCPARTSVVAADVQSARLLIGTTTTRTIDLVAVVQDPCRVSRVDLTLRSPDSVGSFRAHWLRTEGDYSYWEVAVDLTAADLLNADAGTWTTSVTAKGSTTATEAGPTVKVLRNSLVTLDATPEPVTRGEVLTLTGKVERANWETGKYAGYSDRAIQLQWRAAGDTSTYTTLKTVRSGRAGTIVTTVHAGRDGCYRFVFTGSPVAGDATAKGDCIDVR